MMNINLLGVVTPPSIYHGCSTWKTFWEGKFTGKEKFTLGEFTAVNMKIFDCRNVRKHREIENSDKYITLEISMKFGSLEKMRIKSSEPEVNLERSGKGFITSMGIKSKVMSKKYKRSMYAIVNVSMKNLSNIIRKFGKLTYKFMRR